MFCINCGKELPDDAKFCSGCGKQIEAKKEEIINTVPVCSYCGEELKPGNKFCIKCGHPIEENKTEEKHEEKQIVNEQILFTPTAPIWLNQIPEYEDQFLDKQYLYSLRFFINACNLDGKNQDTWGNKYELLANAIAACPFVLDYYWERGLFLSFLCNGGRQLCFSDEQEKENEKMVIQDMTTIINAIPKAGFKDNSKAGVPYYLRGCAQMFLNGKEKEIIGADFKKALELGIGYDGGLFNFLWPEAKQRTEEEHARQLLYQNDNGALKSFFKYGTF